MAWGVDSASVGSTDIQSWSDLNVNHAGAAPSTVYVSSNIEFNNNWGVFGKVCSNV